MEWRTDMENAPQDYFLIWCGPFTGCQVVDGDHYLDREDGARDYFNGDVYVRGSHWMPLPPPPGEGDTP